MLLIRSQLTNVLMYLLLAAFGILGAPLALWSRNGAFRVIKSYCKTMFWLHRVLCGLHVEFRGVVPQNEVLVCSKHMSFMDILMLAYALPQFKFIMKRELVFAPVIGFYAWRIGCAPVARGKKGGAMTKMVSQLEEDPVQGGQTIIFPQGTRVLPGKSREYKVGAGVIYTRLEQACVPVATNVGVFWARKSPLRKPGTAVLEFLEPIPSGMELKDFMEKLETEIESNSDRFMREAGFEFES